MKAFAKTVLSRAGMFFQSQVSQKKRELIPAVKFTRKPRHSSSKGAAPAHPALSVLRVSPSVF